MTDEAHAKVDVPAGERSESQDTVIQWVTVVKLMVEERKTLREKVTRLNQALKDTKGMFADHIQEMDKIHKQRAESSNKIQGEMDVVHNSYQNTVAANEELKAAISHAVKRKQDAINERDAALLELDMRSPAGTVATTVAESEALNGHEEVLDKLIEKALEKGENSEMELERRPDQFSQEGLEAGKSMEEIETELKQLREAETELSELRPRYHKLIDYQNQMEEALRQDNMEELENHAETLETDVQKYTAARVTEIERQAEEGKEDPASAKKIEKFENEIKKVETIASGLRKECGFLEKIAKISKSFEVADTLTEPVEDRYRSVDADVRMADSHTEASAKKPLGLGSGKLQDAGGGSALVWWVNMWLFFVFVIVTLFEGSKYSQWVAANNMIKRAAFSESQLYTCASLPRSASVLEWIGTLVSGK